MEQKTIEKYIDLITEINKGIDDFSAYLISDENKKIPRLKPEIKSDLDSSLVLIPDKRWNDLESIPGSSYHGVYFIFGKEKDKEDSFGVYIGKASHSSTIGHRLYAHLGSSIYQWGNFRLDFINIIPLPEDLHFIAPALEEYLIYHVQNNGIKILNSIGKS